MPLLDEFGREIPGPGKSSQAPTPRKPQHHGHRHHSHNNHHESPHSRRNQQQQPKKALQHPSLAYVSEPLLCEIVWKEQQDKESAEQEATYDAYRKGYCLNYIRSFFNQHMDHSWFRQRYSAALRRQAQRQENRRAIGEAQAFAAALQTPDEVSSLTSPELTGHWFQCQQQQTSMIALIVSEIPSNLTDDQVLTALCADAKKQADAFTLWPVHSKEPYMSRSVCVLAPSDLFKDPPNSLLIECSSDPYNRMEYDADGHGGATADGLDVPTRKVTVSIRAVPPPSIVSLSKALSSPTRHSSDCEKAIQLAAQLDAKQNIPADVRLAALLDRVATEWSVVDRLDTAAAYLRRVHLRNYYHNVDSSDLSFGDMVVTHNLLYVRIKNAPDDEAPDDLLVQSLDQSIERALSPPEEQDLEAEAEGIERDMRQVEQKWLRDHNLSDNRQRARCSFHFCKKLFQDSSFLDKHLYKKHGEFLAAEQAKCHDESMMRAWDSMPGRPVPELLVECGKKFGLHPVPLQPGVIPDVVDPEPGLYRKDEELRQVAFSSKRPREEVRERKPRSSGFVDVDDMKEEKIELPMDSVAAAVPVKKKKKKRKLL